ncbi:MAG: glycosyltransferase [Acetobacter sp.]|nr:glycosyltransferase [Bacteroides sp.]MCM1341559.1 glycosyltransferase [Acetobacter sp.]MCM1433636.1 glycosyltransferase [Clostridiales bacterium]
MIDSIISIIVPVYNVEKYLDKCIESIVNQTYRNLEIILVDDGSSDDCPAICDKWAEKDDRIKVIHKKNGGVSSARNAGLEAASGDYIGFIDSDDFIKENMYEELIGLTLKHSCDVSVCNFFSNKDNVLYYAEGFYDNKILQRYLSDELCCPSVCIKLYKKDIVSNIRFNEKNKIGEDYLFNFYVLKRANAIAVSGKKLYCYNDRENSAVNTLDANMVYRWKNTKFILNNGNLNEDEKNTLLKKYNSELLCIAREIIRDDKNNLTDCFYEIADEIKKYRVIFNSLNCNSKFAKCMNNFICKSPKLFKLCYRLYSKL